MIFSYYKWVLASANQLVSLLNLIITITWGKPLFFSKFQPHSRSQTSAVCAKDNFSVPNKFPESKFGRMLLAPCGLSARQTYEQTEQIGNARSNFGFFAAWCAHISISVRLKVDGRHKETAQMAIKIKLRRKDPDKASFLPAARTRDWPNLLQKSPTHVCAPTRVYVHNAFLRRGLCWYVSTHTRRLLS